MTSADDVGAWEKYHALPQADWELLPVDQLAGFIKYAEINVARVSSIIDVGCGKGLPLLCALAANPSLNREDVSARGLDFVQEAITVANCNLAHFRSHQGGKLNCFRDASIVHQQYVDVQPLKAKVNFYCQDFIKFTAEPADLVIDWMCLHDTPQHNESQHIANLKCLSNKLLILCAFSEHEMEGVPRKNVHNDPRIPKRHYDREEIQAKFGDEFSIVRWLDYPPDPAPVPEPSDEVVEAKRAYLLVRLS